VLVVQKPNPPPDGGRMQEKAKGGILSSKKKRGGGNPSSQAAQKDQQKPNSLDKLEGRPALRRNHSGKKKKGGGEREWGTPAITKKVGEKGFPKGVLRRTARGGPVQKVKERAELGWGKEGTVNAGGVHAARGGGGEGTMTSQSRVKKGEDRLI